MYGADVAQLKELATALEKAAERLDSSRVQVTNRIQVAAWIGPVASMFRLTWNSTYRPNLSTAAVLLRDNAKKLRTNADEQDKASRADGSASSGAAPTIGAKDGETGYVRNRWGLWEDPGWSDWRKAIGVWTNAVVVLDAAGRDGADPPGSYRLLEDWELEAMMIDPSLLHTGSGFDAYIYQGPTGQLVVAYPGTEGSLLTPSADWQTNIGGAGAATDQDREAIRLAEMISMAQPGTDVLYVGHSHGGRLAAISSITSGFPAVTVNAEGVSGPALEAASRAGGGVSLSEARAKVSALHVDGDPLTAFEVSIMGRGAFGTPIELPSNTDLLSGVEDPLYHHSIKAAKDGLGMLPRE
jgi:hypothetical protein